MDLNALGDFLAGVAAPLAFLWLVIGYFQQSESLTLQIKELTNSVRQQASLATTNEEQLKLNKENADFEKRKLEASVEPRLCLSGRHSSTSNGHLKYALRIYNGGHGITCITLQHDKSEIQSYNGLQHGGYIDFDLKFNGLSDGYICFIRVIYLNGLSVERQITFKLGFEYSDKSIPKMCIINRSGSLKPLTDV